MLKSLQGLFLKLPPPHFRFTSPASLKKKNRFYLSNINLTKKYRQQKIDYNFIKFKNFAIAFLSRRANRRPGPSSSRRAKCARTGRPKGKGRSRPFQISISFAS